MNPVDPRVHAGERMYGDHVPHWREQDGSCSYCGSISVPEAIRRMRTPGAKFSGTDKTTYKVYLDPPTGYVNTMVSGSNKFYTRHLNGCTDAELAEFDALSRKVFGLAFLRDEKGILCRYPRTANFYGFQTSGAIGPDGEPVFEEGSPKAPGPEFWA